MSFHIIIPARAASSRLPDKPLADIAGLPMIVRVIRQAEKAGALGVWVATDDARIFDTVQRHGGQALMTRNDHPSGTDRLAQACDLLALDDEQIIVNVQGDEPQIEPELVRQAAQLLADSPDAVMSTCASPIRRAEDLFDPNIVKVVCDNSGHALYFSRAPMPWARDALASHQAGMALPGSLAGWQHIGLYAYRAGFLRRYPMLARGQLEQIESLEQLRVLEHGYRIAVHQTAQPALPGIDTPADLERIRRHFAKPT